MLKWITLQLPVAEVNPEIYYFDSFGNSSATSFLASGTVETTGVASDGYKQVKVLTNSSSDTSWINATFYVDEDVETDGSEAVQLFTDAGTTGTGVYVKVYESAPARSVSFTVNDGTDAVSGATVLIDNSTSKTTGGAGGCTASLTDGTHTVAITKDGFEDYSGSITLSYEDTSFTISLTETN